MREFILKYKWVLFFVIVVTHFAFKFYKVGDNGLWLDECYSVMLGHKPLNEIIAVAKIEEPNPPLYGIAMHYWINAFGDSETSVRSLTVLASSLAGGVLFLLCLRFFNWQTSIFASIMYIASNELYYYGQEARVYGLILLWVLLSYYLFLSLIERPTLIKAVLFAVVNVFIFYSHFLACLVIIGEVVLFPFFAFSGSKIGIENENMFFHLKTKAKVLIYSIVSVILLAILAWPWKDRTIFLLLEGGKAMWLAKPVYADFKQCIYDFFNNKALYQAHIFSAILFVVLLCIKKFRHEGFSWKMLLFAAIAGPGLLYLNYFLAGFTPIFLKRYVLFTALGFIMLYAYLFSMLNFNVLVKLGLFLILGVFSFSKITFPRESYYDYHKAVPYLTDLQKNKTTLVINDVQDVYAYYFDREIFRIGKYHLKHQALRQNDIYTPFSKTWPIDEDFSKYRDIYYTRTMSGYYDPQGETVQMLNKRYKWAGEITGYRALQITHYINPEFKPQ